MSVILAGLALAPASAASSGRLPAATRLCPSGATVTDNATCSDSVYAVFNYSGPGSTISGIVQSAAGVNKLDQPLTASRTVVLLLAKPRASDSVSSTLTVTTTGSYRPLDLSPAISLQRSC